MQRFNLWVGAVLVAAGISLTVWQLAAQPRQPQPRQRREPLPLIREVIKAPPGDTSESEPWPENIFADWQYPGADYSFRCPTRTGRGQAIHLVGSTTDDIAKVWAFYVDKAPHPPGNPPSQIFSQCWQRRAGSVSGSIVDPHKGGNFVFFSLSHLRNHTTIALQKGEETVFVTM